MTFALAGDEDFDARKADAAGGARDDGDLAAEI
jgi:hypothetical protein